MVETKAKVWYKKDKNIIEVTAIDNVLIMDTFPNKKSLLKRYFQMIKFILFNKTPTVENKEELVQSLNGFIDDYYNEENEADIVKQQVLVDLDLVEKPHEDISYIG